MSISGQKIAENKPASPLGYPSIGNHIMKFLLPSTSHRTDVEAALGDYRAMALVNKNMYNIYEEEVIRLSKIHYFLNKYSEYQGLYEETGEVFNGNGPPQLYDALLSGSRFGVRRSCDEYTKDVEEDIKWILKLLPESMHYNGGSLASRLSVNPLAIACYNKNVPVYVIDWLFQNGADPAGIVKKLDGENISIYSDAKRHNRPRDHWTAEENQKARVRFRPIVELFARYGLEEAKKDLEEQAKLHTDLKEALEEAKKARERLETADKALTEAKKLFEEKKFPSL